MTELTKVGMIRIHFDPDKAKWVAEYRLGWPASAEVLNTEEQAEELWGRLRRGRA